MLVIPSLVLPLSLLLANALHQGVRGSRVLRIGFFFPNLLGVAGILLWQQLYNPAGGPINAALSGLGLRSFEGFPWLAPQNLYTALIPMGLWGACGFNMVLLLAAMQGVPRDLYEAAELYGAGAWQKFRFITLPLIWPTVIAAFLFMVIGAMKAFEVIWLLTNQAPTTETHVLGTLMVRSMFVEHRVGQAAAMACLLFAVVLVCSLLAERILSREET
jgi:raffinose/stachyose/melibiose transport system permease protein